MEYTHTFSISADHPALAGHFPGDPIVPGVVILNEVINALDLIKPGVCIVGISVLKFMQPLRPEKNFKIVFKEDGSNTINFSCELGATQLVAGKLKIDNKVKN